MDTASATANTQLLRDNNYSFPQLLSSCHGTTVQPGSEFRRPDQLATLFGPHPNWAFFLETLTTGMDYHFVRHLTEGERRTELQAMLDRGNHKSANDHRDKVRRLLEKDVTHGFSFVFDPAAIPQIPSAMVQPLGVVEQFTLTATGDRTLKHRLTQDLTFSLAVDKASVNHRIDMDKYPEMFYGFCLQRVIHFTVALRAKAPCTPILIAKYDYSDAYRRVAHSPSAVAQSIVVFEDLAFAALRLTFGGSPNPPGFCAFSEMVADLANELRLCRTSWDPRVLFSPSQPKPPIPLRLPASVSFAPAARLAVNLQTPYNGMVDCFIDDLINVFLDEGDHWEREAQLVPLAIHACSRPHAGDAEPIPRHPILSPEKLQAEGTPAEVQVVLATEIYTRSLTIALPADKFTAWDKDVQAAYTAGKLAMGALDSLVGKLNHAAYVIPLSRHFIARLRKRLDRGKGKSHSLQFHRSELLDLSLWRTFLRQARDGISLNNLVLQTPTKVCWSDSCPLGLGGFTLSSGRAWRLRIPDDSVLQTHKGVNNLLEFLAIVITVLLVLEEPPSNYDRPDCIMALSDNTSAISWLFRSKYDSVDDPLFDAKTMVARRLASAVTQSGHCLSSQHLKGENNIVADYLSFAGTHRAVKHHPLAYDCPDDATLTHRFHSALPQLIPPSFNISPLPSDVFSFALLVLQTAESSLIRAQNKPTSPKTVSGDAGATIAEPSALAITSTSIVYPNPKKSSSSDASWNYSGKPSGTLQAELLASVRSRWSDHLLRVPQGLWARRFGQISNQAPCTSPTKTSYSPQSPNTSEHATTRTQLRNDTVPLHPNS